MHSVFVANATLEKVVAKLREGAAKAAPGAWIKAGQFDASITPGMADIDLALLDQIAPRHDSMQHIGTPPKGVIMANCRHDDTKGGNFADASHEIRLPR